MIDQRSDAITIENVQTKQFVWAVAGCVVGYLLVHFSCLSGGPQEARDWAGLVAGVLVLCLSLYMAVMNPKEIILIDAKRRFIQVKTHTKFSNKVQCIRFADIKTVEVGETGDREGGSIIYYVDLILLDGSHRKIFHGFYEGNTQYSTMQQYCKLIQNKMSTSS